MIVNKNELEKDSNWTSIDDRLPDPFERVIAYSSNNGTLHDCYMTGKQDVYGQHEWINSSYFNIEGEEISHWMSLPQLPEK